MAFEKINEFAADKQKLCVEHDTISDELFREYGVNRGLRDINGKGVLTGLTRISKVRTRSLRRRAVVPRVQHKHAYKEPRRLRL